MKNHKNIHCFLAARIKTLGVAFFSTCLLYSAFGQSMLPPVLRNRCIGCC